MADASPASSPIQGFIEHDGCRLAFTVRGPAQGVPILMIQGVGVHGEGWKPQAEVLSDRYRCVTFDNRGVGQSQPQSRRVDGNSTSSPSPELSIEQMSSDALAIMDAQGWASAHVVGHSLGGLIAQDLALRFRSRVRGLVLLCTFSRGRDVTTPTPAMIWLGLKMRFGPRKWRRRAFLSLVMPPDVLAQSDREVLAASLEPLFGHDLADQPPIVGKQLAAMDKYDATPRLAELAGLPVLVASADHDRIARKILGEQIVEKIPGARFVEFPEAAHGLPLQCPEQISALLREHIDHVEKTSNAQMP